MKHIALLLFLFPCFSCISQELTDEETRLYQLIMEYRKEYDLPEIPLSKSLTFVAKTHTKDLNENFTFGSECNMHSWSSKGKWTPVCYTKDHAQARSVWNKPGELTSYKGYGYEIAHGGQNYVATASGALAGWKKSPGHNSVILNMNKWDEPWSAIGISISGSFAVVWFGNEPDPAN